MSKTLVLQPIEAIFSFKISRITGIDPYCILVSDTNKSVSEVCYNSGNHPFWGKTLLAEVDHEPKCLLQIKDKVMLFRDRSIGSVELDLKEIEAKEIVSKWFPIIKDSKSVGKIFLRGWIDSNVVTETNEKLGIDTVECQQGELVKQSSLSDSLDHSRTTVSTLDSLAHGSAEKDLSKRDIIHKETNGSEIFEGRKSDSHIVQNLSDFLHPEEEDLKQNNEIRDKDSKAGIFNLTEIGLHHEDGQPRIPTRHDRLSEQEEFITCKSQTPPEEFVTCNGQAVSEPPVQISQSNFVIENEIDSFTTARSTGLIKEEGEENSSLVASNVMEKKEEYESEYPVNFLEDDFNDNTLKKKDVNNPFLRHMGTGRESNEKVLDESEQEKASDDQVISSYASSSEDKYEDYSIDDKALKGLRFLFDGREGKMKLRDKEEEKHSCSEEACDKFKSFDQSRHLNEYTTNFSQTESKEEEKIEVKGTKEKIVVLSIENTAHDIFGQEYDVLKKQKAEIEAPVGQMWGIYDLDIFNYTLRDIPGYDYEKYLSFKVNGEEMVYKDVYNYKVVESNT